MKIVKFKQFLESPEGTIFSYFEPCIFNGLFKKRDTIYSEGKGIDFFYQELISPIKCSGSDEMNDILIEAEKGEEFELDYTDENISREGFFDEEQLYAIYSQEDIKGLVRQLSNYFIGVDYAHEDYDKTIAPRSKSATQVTSDGFNTDLEEVQK